MLGLSPCTLKTEKLFNSEVEASADVVGCTSDFEVAIFGMGAACSEEPCAHRADVLVVALVDVFVSVAGLLGTEQLFSSRLPLEIRSSGG